MATARMLLGIAFYGGERVALGLESDASAEDEPEAEITLACLLTARMLVNLGPQPNSDLLVWALTTAHEGHNLVDLLEGGHQSLAPYVGPTRRSKGFEMPMVLTDGDAQCRMNIWGFHRFSKAVSYCSPAAVQLLVGYLACGRSTDASYLSSLGGAVSRVCRAWQGGEISLFNQPMIAMRAVAASLGGDGSGWSDADQ